MSARISNSKLVERDLRARFRMFARIENARTFGRDRTKRARRLRSTGFSIRALA
jgi:hypothetical protein